MEEKGWAGESIEGGGATCRTSSAKSKERKELEKKRARLVDVAGAKHIF